MTTFHKGVSAALATVLLASMALVTTTPAQADPPPTAGGKYYFLLGADNFNTGLSAGLLDTKLEVPTAFQTALGGATITYNNLYKLIGAPEQDMGALPQPTTGPLADPGIAAADWPNFQTWLLKVASPQDDNQNGYADVDANADGTVSIAEQDARDPFDRAMAYNTLYIGPHPGYTNPDAYSTTLVYADTVGYDKKLDGTAALNKLPDYMLTTANKVTIPLRFNVTRNDIFVANRSQLPGDWSTLINYRAEIDLHIADSDGVATQAKSVNPNYYLNAKVFPHLTQHFYSSGRLNTLELLGLSVFGSQHGATFNDDANTIAATFNDYQYNLKNTWSTGFGGSGAHLALEGYFRQGIGASTTSIGDEESAYTASDAVREANAIRTWRVTSKVRNINASGEFCPDPDDHPGAVANHHNGGTLATGNEAVFDLEVTRPTITTVSTGQGRTATYEAGKSNFTNVIGAGAVTISDAGVKKQVNADGDLEFIGTEDAADRTVVLVRYVPATGTPTAWGSITAVGTDTAPGKYNLGSASDTANLAAYLATLNHGDTVELLYTYAAADADPSLVGELPGDGGSLTAAAEKELGAYATPLLKTITIAETWTLYYDANIPSDATDAVPPIQMPANQTGIPLNTASAALGSPTGVPVKAHGTYTFAGWSNTAGDSATVDYSATATITSDNDKAVHAVWTWTADPSYTVTYHANYPAAATAGAGQVPIDEQHYAGETVSVTVIDPGVPTRAGGTYIFLGWSTDKDAGSAMYTSALRILTMPLHDVELYAIWQWNPLYTETEHTVRFWNDSVELTGTYAKQTVKDGSLAVNPGALPNTETRTFEGWVYNGVLFDFNTPITHDYDLVAKWSVQSYVPTPTPSESEKPQATPSASDEPEDEPDDDDDDLAYTGTQDPSGPLGLAGIVVLLGTAAIAIRRRP